MTEQLRLDGQKGPRSRVESTVDCGTAGPVRIVLHLDERPDGTDVETVRIVAVGHVSHVPIAELETLLRALSRARDVSSMRRVRRGQEP